ncbi:MAG: ABC transporter ATP-binding protein [Alphaproteobacteria bacterium]
MSGLSLRRIEKSFGATQVLRGVDLDIADGEFLTLVGASGCGKSTLLRIIAGLETQDAGSVAIGGAPVDHLRPHERRVAMVFQSYALYPHMTVFRNIAMPLVMARMSLLERLPILRALSPGRRARMEGLARDVEATAAQLQIQALLQRKPSQLSGGQRQRVALGRAMVRQPDVFLMDEPLSNLDAKLRVHMRAELAELHRRLGTTFVYVTHDQVEAMTMSDRVAVMDAGEILQLGTPTELYERPSNTRVARFIGSPAINLLPARAGADGVVEMAGMRLGLRVAARAGEALGVGLRPEALRPVADAAGAGRVLRARLRRRENLGAESILHADLAMGDEAIALSCRVPAGGPPLPADGAQVAFAFDEASCHVFGANEARLEAIVA